MHAFTNYTKEICLQNKTTKKSAESIDENQK